MKLVSRKFIGKHQVFDLTVEKNHNFVASGAIVHNCVTYDLQTKIWNQLSKANRSRLLCRDMDILAGKEKYPTKLSNADLLDQHTKDGKSRGSVLLSPSMMEGIDLKDDLSDFQIIVKLPWAYLGDVRIKRKSELDESWYRNKMWLSVLQASGRSTRHEGDSSVTYILDSGFEFWFKKWEHKLPDWFKHRLVFD
jgi:hypothetical protein